MAYVLMNSGSQKEEPLGPPELAVEVIGSYALGAVKRLSSRSLYSSGLIGMRDAR